MSSYQANQKTIILVGGVAIGLSNSFWLLWPRRKTKALPKSCIHASLRLVGVWVAGSLNGNSGGGVACWKADSTFLLQKNDILN